MAEQKIFRNFIHTPTDSELDNLAKNNQNLLLIGEAGSGKTARMLACMERNKIKFRYFSTPTMDPFLDLRGIPKEVTVDGKPTLDFILPKHMTDDVEAFIFDEPNRSHKSVTASIMELIQFKSINGHKFPKLRFIWSAINPHTEDGKYQVDELDPALRDRFHAIMQVEYKCDRAFFRKEFGKVGDIACDWWKTLSPEQNLLCSPRRLEYALRAVTSKKPGNVKMYIPPDCNPEKLINMLEHGSPREAFSKAISDKDTKTIYKMVNDENIYQDILDMIVDNKDLTLPLLKQERATALLSENVAVKRYVFDPKNGNQFTDLIKSLLDSTNTEIKGRAQGFLSNKDPLIDKLVNDIKSKNPSMKGV